MPLILALWRQGQEGGSLLEASALWTASSGQSYLVNTYSKGKKKEEKEDTIYLIIQILGNNRRGSVAISRPAWVIY